MSGPQPFHALWKPAEERAGTGLLMEFVALANHRKVIAAEIADQAADSARPSWKCCRDRIERTDLGPDDLSPEAILVLIASVSRTIALEESLGMDVGLAADHGVHRGPADPHRRRRLSAT